MQKQKFFIFTLALILLSQIVQSQDQILEKAIYLTQNEQYYLNLNSYYDQIINSINLPQNSDKLQSISPSQVTQTYQAAITMNQILPTSYPVNSNQKYISSIIPVQNDQQYDYYLVFGRINHENNSIQSQELDRVKIFSHPNGKLQIYTSMYSSNQGFAIVIADNVNQSINQFTFIEDQHTLQIEKVTSDQVIMNPKSYIEDNQIFTLIQNRDYVYLLSYDQTKKQMNTVNKISNQCYTQIYIKEVTNIPNFYIIRQCNDIILFYSYTKQSQYIYFQVPQSSSFTNAFSQLVDQYIYLSFINNSSLIICQFTTTNLQQKIYLNICKTQQLTQQYSNPVFISNSLILLSSSNSLALFDFFQSKIIFQQSAPSDQTFSFYNFLNNQALITFNKANGQAQEFYQTQSIQFASPAIIINAYNQIINFSITVGPIALVYKGRISVNVVNQQQITFNTPSVSFGQVYSGIRYNNELGYYLPIEQYIAGSNLQQLNLNPTNGQQQNIQNLQIQQLQNTQTLNPQQIDDSYKVFKLDQSLFNVLIQQKQSDTQYSIQYGKMADLNKELTLITPKNNNLVDSVVICDSQGSFTLQSDSTQTNKRIFVPAQNSKLEVFINIIQVPCDTNQYQFTFSSDIYFGTILVLCGNRVYQINYQAAYSAPFSPLILNQVQLPQDFSTYNKIICINGIALIYGNTSIIAFNYINQIIVGTTLSIPTLGKTQIVSLFRNTFFLLYSDDKNNNFINQYSYNNFSSDKPQLMRNIQIDSQYIPNINVQPITLNINDSNGDSYLLVQVLGNANNYIIYRVNNCSTQNQFYAIITIQNGLNIFTYNSVCSLGQNVICQVILKGAQLLLQPQFTQDQYQSNILLTVTFTASPNNQQGGTTQNYMFILRRDTSAQYGIVNQKATSIQVLKTQLQDNNASANTDFVLDDCSDPTIYNGNLLGWKLENSDGEIINRLTRGIPQVQTFVLYKILYNLSLSVNSQNFSINNIVINDKVDYTNCIPLEDSSQTIYTATSTQFNLYFVCSSTIAAYQINLTKGDNGQYTVSKIISFNTYTINQNIPNPFIFNRMFSSSNNDIRLYGINKSDQIQIEFDENKKTANTIQLTVDQQVYVSSNVINSFNDMVLQFKPDGTIFTTKYDNNDASTNALYNLKNLLLQQKLFVDEQDIIGQVRQISDQVFNIQFLGSYIYQITFNFSEDNILSIKTAQSYDYSNGFSTMIGYYQNSAYTLFIGQNNSTQIMVNLYKNSQQKQNFNLINGWSSNTFEEAYNIVTAVGENDSQTFNIFLQNSKVFQIFVKPTTLIEINQNQFSKKTFSIIPILSDLSNTVSFSWTSQRISHQGIMSFICSSFIVSLILLL